MPQSSCPFKIHKGKWNLNLLPALFTDAPGILFPLKITILWDMQVAVAWLFQRLSWSPVTVWLQAFLSSLHVADWEGTWRAVLVVCAASASNTRTRAGLVTWPRGFRGLRAQECLGSRPLTGQHMGEKRVFLCAQNPTHWGVSNLQANLG